MNPSKINAIARRLGPGLITGAADDDPSGIATYSQAGAQFGYGLLWTLVLTLPLMTAIELELFRHLLTSIAEEMGVVLRKSSYSANIKERRDYSCAVYDRRGDTVAMGDHMPVHLGAMPLSVRAAMDAFDLQEGDVARGGVLEGLGEEVIVIVEAQREKQQ